MEDLRRLDGVPRSDQKVSTFVPDRHGKVTFPAVKTRKNFYIRNDKKFHLHLKSRSSKKCLPKSIICTLVVKNL